MAFAALLLLAVSCSDASRPSTDAGIEDAAVIDAGLPDVLPDILPDAGMPDAGGEVGGALLITPGFITDVAGFSLIFPPTREAIKIAVMRHIERRIREGEIRVYRY